MKTSTRSNGAGLRALPNGVVNVSNIASYINTLNKQSINYHIVLATVVDVILDSSHPQYVSDDDIGRIMISFIDKSSNNNNIIASPISSDTTYPYKNEIVFVISFLNQYYYMGILNSGNNPSGNINNVLGTSIFDDSPLERSPEYKRPKIKAGDKVIYGRKFNTIKLMDDSSIYISAGEADGTDISANSVYDDVYNAYKSFIWLTKADVDFSPSTSQKSNYLKSTADYNSLTNDSIILSSDKIVINSNNYDVSIFSARGIYLNTSSYVGIDSIKDIMMTTKNNFNVEANISTTIDCPKINLGKSPTEPIVLGNKLVDLLSELLEQLIKETHMTGTGLSTPPTNVSDYIRIKSKLKTILSKNNKSL